MPPCKVLPSSLEAAMASLAAQGFKSASRIELEAALRAAMLPGAWASNESLRHALRVGGWPKVAKGRWATVRG